MLKKIILSSILATIFFCGQCLAAQEDIALGNKNQNDFVDGFNLAANNNGGFILGTPTILPLETNPNNNHLYESDAEGMDLTAYVITDSENFVNRIIFMTSDLEVAKKIFKPALLAIALTENEITAEPIFEDTATVNSFWCAEAKRYINVTTASVPDNPGNYYILILASFEKLGK